MLPIFFATFVAAVSAAVTSPGACLDLPAIPNFDIAAYQGLWYEISAYPYPGQNPNGQCPTAQYMKLSSDTIRVRNAYNLNKVQNNIQGTGRFAADANNAAKLIITFTFAGQPRDSPLQVVLTDYQNYAIAYNCNYNAKTDTHNKTAWILSRTKTLEGDSKCAVDDFIAANPDALDASKLIVNDFSDEACSYTSTTGITDDPYNP